MHKVSIKSLLHSIIFWSTQGMQTSGVVAELTLLMWRTNMTNEEDSGLTFKRYIDMRGNGVVILGYSLSN